MSSAEKVYAWILHVYPREFRTAYGREMALAFRHLRREHNAPPALFWAAIVWDVLRSAPTLRAESFSNHWQADLNMGGKKMKTMAILAVLIGALEAVNTIVEAMARNSAGASTPITTAAIGLAVLIALILLGSGVALLLHVRGAASLARNAAIACLVVFAAIAVLQPMFSILATLLGIAFPATLLAFLYRDSTTRHSAA